MGVPNAAFVHLTTSEIRTPPYYPLGNLFDPMLSRVVYTGQLHYFFTAQFLIMTVPLALRQTTLLLLLVVY